MGQTTQMALDRRPDGYELPVAQALAEPVLMAGMPRDYAILMGTIALMLVYIVIVVALWSNVYFTMISRGDTQ